MRPTVKIYKSNSAIEAQLIESGKTLLGRKYKFIKGDKPVDQAAKFGEDFGKALKEAKVTQVAFDRNGSKYHGRVKSFADGIRSAGLEF